MAKKKSASAELPLVTVADPSDELAVFRKQDAIVADLKAKYMSLTIAGVSDRDGFDAVHKARMIVRDARVGVEKTRVELKSGLLDRGRRIDAEAKRVTALLDPIEDYLQRQEDVIVKEKERIKAEEEAARKARIKKRFDALQQLNFKGDFTLVPEMSNEEFDRLLIAAHRAKAEDDRLAEEKRERDAAREAELAAEKKRLADIAAAQEEELRVLRAQNALIKNAPDSSIHSQKSPVSVQQVEAQTSQVKSELETIQHADTVKSLVERSGVAIDLLTCYDCPQWRGCEFAFDAYNIDGDCLADK